MPIDEEIDPRFREAKRRAAKRRRKRGAARLALPVLAVAGIGAVVALTWDKWTFGPVEVTEESLQNDLAATGLDEDLQAASAFSAAFVDLAGDPLLIRFPETEDDDAIRTLSAPSSLLQPERVTPKLLLVSDVMVSAEERFITTLPSSQDDFAFFNARKSSAAPAPALPDAVPDAPPVIPALRGDDADIGNDYEADVLVARSAVQNNTSRVEVLPEDRRPKAPRDVFVRISAQQSLSSLLTGKQLAVEDVAPVAEAAAELLSVTDLEEGQVVALRGQDVAGQGFRFRQLSIYDAQTYFGSLALADDGGITTATDPWVEDDLFDYTGAPQDTGSQEIRYRMLDAFYSTAIRNRVPSALVGEAIALLSSAHDLEAFAAPGDRMSMLYAQERLEDDTGAGQILYVALQGNDVSIECFVYRERPGGDYRCYGATPDGSGAALGPRPGMVTPVQGVLTSRFGPRNHPILKEVRLHAGVDWAAPTGTPVVAAFGGTVIGAGVAGGYGNLVRIQHPDGTETRYAHLDTMMVEVGAQVPAGAQIGTVGTTGRSTGPHLHFELHEGGAPVDPFGGGGIGAVDQLVARIVQVESAGVADARNPLSTATGLGQFIEGTWIRMMNTYRPDLAETLAREELLALRTDPTLSREMVAHLAREGEAYLRARGHAITAGRLYLCHFLGAKGADLVLSSDDGEMLLDVLGEAVIAANPFLTGKTVAYIKEWAERKMRGSGAARIRVAEPAGLPEFRTALQALLGTG